MANRVSIIIDGFNQVRLLNSFASNGIDIYGLDKKTSSNMCVVIALKDEIKAIAILEKMCYTYNIDKSTNAILWLSKNWWMLICIVCIIGLLVCSNFFIWKVDIMGAEGITKVNIEKIVDDYGLGFLSSKPTDFENLSNSILSLDEVASVRVEMNGAVLEVEVLIGSENTPISKGGVVNSQYDAVVSRVIAESGTALVSAGDVVSRGEPLITGELMATLDGSLSTVSVAKGSVYGDVTFAYHLPICDGIEWVSTGNSVVSTDVNVFGVEFANSEVPYEWYKTKTTVSNFFFFEMTQTEYIEVEASVVQADIVQFIMEKTSELEVVYNSEFEAKYLIDDSSSMEVLRVYLTAEICIGKTE